MDDIDIDVAALLVAYNIPTLAHEGLVRRLTPLIRSAEAHARDKPVPSSASSGHEPPADVYDPNNRDSWCWDGRDTIDDDKIEARFVAPNVAKGHPPPPAEIRKLLAGAGLVNSSAQASLVAELTLLMRVQPAPSHHRRLSFEGVLFDEEGQLSMRIISDRYLRAAVCTLVFVVAIVVVLWNTPAWGAAPSQPSVDLLNPFATAPAYYVPAHLQAGAAATLGALPADDPLRAMVETMAAQPSAFWLDSKAKVALGSAGITAETILESAAAMKPAPPLVTFVLFNVRRTLSASGMLKAWLYSRRTCAHMCSHVLTCAWLCPFAMAPPVRGSPPQLPNRDCDNAASGGGDICCQHDTETGLCDMEDGGECDAGVTDYEDHFLAPLAQVRPLRLRPATGLQRRSANKKTYEPCLAVWQVLSRFNGVVPVALVLEPYSLASLVTNARDPFGGCGSSATASAYRNGLTSAVAVLASACPACTLYLDAAHGGRLGAKRDRDAFAALVKRLGVADRLRGFATNVGRYQPTGEACPKVRSARSTRPHEHHTLGGLGS